MQSNELSLPDDYLTFMPVSGSLLILFAAADRLVSKTLGIGPDCASKLEIPHSSAVADAIIVKRHAFLAEEVSQ